MKMGEFNSVECNSTEITYNQSNRETILNRARDNYENKKKSTKRKSKK